MDHNATVNGKDNILKPMKLTARLLVVLWLALLFTCPLQAHANKAVNTNSNPRVYFMDIGRELVRHRQSGISIQTEDKVDLTRAKDRRDLPVKLQELLQYIYGRQ